MNDTERSLTLPAHAKINLSLRVLGKRSDGYHSVDTRMVRLSVADQVTVKQIEGQTSKLTCSDETLPLDESNLALKALRVFEERCGPNWKLFGDKRPGPPSWSIHLEKQVPAGAGLGGGSSDAAAVLKALNQLSGSPFSLAQLAEMAGPIGSDVPFFLYDSVCDATGRGEVIEPVPFPHELNIVLVKPPFGIPTAWAYQKWKDSEELKGVLYAQQICPWGTMVNDLERPVFAKHLLLPSLKMWLLEQPETLAAMMSGSGSTVFAVACSGVEAARLAERAQQWCGETSWVRLAKTLPNR
ncbi:MAG: 4-diphosphocytidyl-2C-methyl-D-erythritol kinase [Verrucomicrobiaceae bacterium]|nr:4-diphosphocytidyl-2C-methyl-D-erythritol kinase [Verrucomicrobiaceae bacterium]